MIWYYDKIVVNPRRMRRRVIAVVLCVCLSVCLLPRNLPHTSFVRQKQGVIGSLRCFQDFCRVAFASFKSSGIICRLPLPSSLPDELPMDRRDSNSFFSTRIVYTVSDSIYNTTDSSLIKHTASWLSSCVCWSGMTSHGTAVHYVIVCNVHTCVLVVTLHLHSIHNIAI